MSSFPILYAFFPPGFFIPFVATQLVFGVYLYKYMPETKGRAVCDIIEAMDEEVASRSFSFIEENIPLIKSRTSTYDKKYVPNKQIF
uniref:MFS domain-containing protein n=1 Tax=Caenorhabditis tropicalis TaxID=1561998 RepID=A0A1I7UAE8_9PELO